LTNVDVGSGTYSSSGGGALVVENGAYAQFIGTSLATPIWAAAIALLNEERAMNGMGPIGLLNPHLYPLAGTNSFNDIVSGSNGAYNAGPGYDLCTGIGSPRFSELIGALSNPVTSRKIVNLSARAEVGTGANALFTGFVIQGPPGSVKGILVRGVGPALAPFGLTGVLQQPVLSVYDSNSVLIAINAGWGNFPTPGTSDSGALIGQATGAEMSAAGAFSLPAGSGDSAMLLILPPGSYSMQVSGVGGTSGVAMSEIYDLNASVPAVITNFSNRCYVGTGANVEVSGFVVEGNLSANLLIRGIGPALAGFGLSGVLAQPTISLYDSGNNLIASNSGWGSAVVVGTSSTAATWRQATAADMTSAGAFPLTTGSSDSAMVVSLPPGAYTVVMAGVGASTGTGLAEVYELSGP